MKTAYSYIRFSTPDQALGDSERRQLEKAKVYASANNLKLSDRCFADRGVSAFHGKHRRNGELKTLLETVKSGEVLLLEDTDRWSREDPLDALTALRDHVRQGIDVVFLRTGTRVTKDNFADMSVIVPNFFSSLLANQESEKKSERIQAGWDKRRALARAGQAVRINRLPCWLAWDKEADKVVVNEDKAKVVRRIFELARAGHTRLEIVQKLRSEGVPPVSSQKKRAAWNTVMVRRLLSSKATIGFYMQADPPVPNVWPAIVPENLFHAVQREIDIAPVNKRPGVKSNSNLFTGLAVCGCCGKYNLNAHIGGKNGTPKLICQGGHRGQTDCGHSSVPIDLVEKSCLDFLGDADLIRPLLSADAKPSRLGELQGRLSDAEKQVKKLSAFILGDDSPSPTLYDRLKIEESRAKQLRSEIEDESARERVEKPAAIAYNEFCSSLPALREDKERRPELRKAIASVIEKLTLNPRGEGKGRWVYELKLRGAAEPVHILIHAPNSWVYESRRPQGLELVA